MKKLFTLFTLVMLLASTTMAQIKLYVHKSDGTRTEFVASEIDSITFSETNTPNNPLPDDEEDEDDVVYDIEAVDLGLSSGILWASCNLGSKNNKPEGYGDYFAWGETSPKDSYTYNNYIWNTQNKYKNKSYIELEDDAARSIWGELWRIPLKEELEELVEECTWTWITQNGVAGYEVQGPNGNTIFLPAAGMNYSADPVDIGTIAIYRSNYKYGQTFNLHLSENKVSTFAEMDAHHGLSIRPVCNQFYFPYILYFNSNGGEGTMERIEFETSEYKTLPKCSFTYEGYKFVGWNTTSDGSGTSYSDMSQITYSGNSVLYAQWEELGEGEEGDDELGKDEETVEFEAVDLGLSVKWANMNIGAKNVGQDGSHFAWGEVETKKQGKYTWNSYKYGTSANYMTKYCTDSNYGEVDGKDILEKSDDVANAVLGGDWRMPTKEEFSELLTKCTITWENSDNLRFTGPSGNYILLPMAGFIKDDSTLKNDGDCGYYWTTSLSDVKSTQAVDVIFIESEMESFEILGLNNGNRCCGLSVRPVLPK